MSTLRCQYEGLVEHSLQTFGHKPALLQRYPDPSNSSTMLREKRTFLAQDSLPQ